MKDKVENKIKHKITGDMTISEIFSEFREYSGELSSVMLESGLHCFGCGASSFETLEEGCLAHGWDEEQIKKIVEELNNVLSEKEKEKEALKKISSPEKFTVTDNAAKKIKSLIGEEENVRIEVIEGMDIFDMDVSKEKEEGEVEFKEKGITFFVKEKSLDSIKGVVLDYAKDRFGEGFKFKRVWR